MKTAVIDVPHMEGERSCKVMLEAAGYTVYGIGPELIPLLSYMPIRSSSRIEPKADQTIFNACDLFVTVKHFAVGPTLKHFPRLNGKLLWFGINAGKPGIPIVSAPYKMNPLRVPVPYVGAIKWYADGSPCAVSGPRYFAYLPLAEKDDYHFRGQADYTSPICLIHAMRRWGGYGWLTDAAIDLGIQFYGNGCPCGVLSTEDVRKRLSTAVCYTHLKSHDCPGYSLYEAMLIGCPVVLPSQFLEMTNYYDLYDHGETCLVVDDPIRDKSQERLDILRAGILEAIAKLRDPSENQRIGRNGRERLLDLMWDSQRDGPEFTLFMQKHFGE
jgi:hypothetical protein